jgi:hypothetical protein
MEFRIAETFTGKLRQADGRGAEGREDRSARCIGCRNRLDRGRHTSRSQEEWCMMGAPHRRTWGDAVNQAGE